MKHFTLALSLSLSLLALYSCGSRGFATKTAEDCVLFCSQQDGQAGSFDKASSTCTCSDLALPPDGAPPAN